MLNSRHKKNGSRKNGDKDGKALNKLIKNAAYEKQLKT